MQFTVLPGGWEVWPDPRQVAVPIQRPVEGGGGGGGSTPSADGGPICQGVSWSPPFSRDEPLTEDLQRSHEIVQH